MHLSTFVEMLDSGLGDRVLLGSSSDGLTGSSLAHRAKCAATTIGDASSVVYAGESHPLLPIPVLAAAWRGVPFVPVNYRLEDDQLRSLIERQPNALVLGDERTTQRLHRAGVNAIDLDTWLKTIGDTPFGTPAEDDNAVAIVLYTSGTTAEPKAALLRHRHLMAYLLGSVEYAGAGDDEAALISVPPYHIAGMANLLSNLFAGRRLVYLRQFNADDWLCVASDEHVTHAMVVPTMLARIVDVLADGATPPADLRMLSYGGSKIASSVIERSLKLFPTTGFVNAYGLTETASTIAVLGPDEHRAAIASNDPTVRARLGSTGRVLPTIEVEVRDEGDRPLPPGERGILFLRGEQVAGEYATGSLLDADGWFCTHDSAWVDADGYLFIEGRADDTIIRGGENIAPAEIEDALMSHPAVEDSCVIGIPDDEWGQRIAAVVVVRSPVDVETLRAHVRERLRSSKTPDEIVIAADLPRTSTGKLLRRTVREQFLGVAT